jgi:hypothetical protein
MKWAIFWPPERKDSKRRKFQPLTEIRAQFYGKFVDEVSLDVHGSDIARDTTKWVL